MSEEPPVPPAVRAQDGTSGELEHAVRVRGAKPGDYYVRVRREDLGAFRRAGGGRLVATEMADQPAGGALGVARRIQRVLIGRPLDTEALETERLPVTRALPILASDPLSSVAYGPEAGLAVLALGGSAALLYNIPIGIGIAILMAVVTTSYRQVVRGYQGGGGSYAVAKANLGVIFGLVAAAALMADYVLTVSVSISSGVDAVVSAFAGLGAIKLGLCLLFVAVLTVGNLRGVREAGAIFAGPTYIFVISLLVLIAFGVVKGIFFDHRPLGHYPPIRPVEAITPLLILTAFASGSSSMTGIEAVSNSVPSFEPPEARNAARTLTILGAILIVLFLGVLALDLIYAAVPFPGGSPTVLSQIAAAVFTGPGRFFFYVIQFATTAVLILAANTSFNGFPRLGAILARDNFLPHRFGYLGNRLVYSTAIFFLAVAASILIATFSGNVDALINLYALGVFTAFTLAQTGMARHWWRERGQGWRRSLAINAVGAFMTGIVDGVIIVTKSPRGAWVVLIVVPVLVALFLAIGRHYATVRRQLAEVADHSERIAPGPALVPLVAFDLATESAFAYALTLNREVIGVRIQRDEGPDPVVEEWKRHSWPEGQVPRLHLTRWKGRSRVSGFLAALDQLRENAAGQTLTVVLPEPGPATFWRQLLSHPDLVRLKLELLRRPGVVAASLPAGHPVRPADPGKPQHVAFVPISNLDPPAKRALSYALTLTEHVVALHVEARMEEPAGHADVLTEALEAWRAQVESEGGRAPVRLVVIDSPYRSVVPPLLAYVDSWRRAHPEPACTVVVPELIVGTWSSIGLHNQRAFWLKTALLGRETVAVADVTYHLRPGRVVTAPA